MASPRTDSLKARFGALRGVPFVKMTGSGNDFVVFDARDVSRELLESPEVIDAICNRNNGIGADGVVVLEPIWAPRPHDAIPHEQPLEHPHRILLKYFNKDGSLGELCGNATLCSTTLAAHANLAPVEAVVLETDSGRVQARLLDGVPQIDLAPVTHVRPTLSEIPRLADESHAGFARVGVPHVVIVTSALEGVDLTSRGRSIRQHASLLPDGANVNWVAPLADGRWAYRTYERGVEGETLACGTGAVASAILLVEWQLASWPVRLVTRSGREVEVTMRPDSPGEAASIGADRSGDPDQTGTRQWHPSLRGEGRVVFRGTIADLG